MKRRPAAKVFLAAAIGLAGGVRLARGQTSDVPIPIETGVAQLFIDDFLIESQSGLKRTLNRPRKDDAGGIPLIAATKGTTLLAYGSIVYDPRLKRHVMFTQEFPSRRMYRCTSADGLEWDAKRTEDLDRVTFDLDLEPGEGAKGSPGIDLFSCYYDQKDGAFPYQGWLYYANCGFEREGIYFVRSRDGRAWERGRQVVNAFAGPGDPSCHVIHQDGKTVYGPGDVTLFARDEKQDRFLGLFKFFSPDAVPPGSNLRSRAYAFLDALDRPFDTKTIKRIALLPPAAQANNDQPFDEYYASTAWRYESLWLGGLKIWHHGGDYPYSSAGCAFLKLLVSRDGLNWKKVPYVNDAGVPEVFIPNGPEGGNDGRNDGGYISEFSQGPMRVGDELIYYYGASSFGKNQADDVRVRGGGIFRARLRRDGFVSADAGTLTTRPLAFRGRILLVNAVGPITVTVLDGGGAKAGSASIEGDSLRHEVRFGGRTLGELLPGSEARLRFDAGAGGRLFSFTIQ